MVSAWPAHPGQRDVVHVDVDAFFASVEQRDDPWLRGKPVAVGTGVVASCSYEARRYGVRTAMRLVEARSHCRDLVIVPGQYPRYEQVARHLLALCQEQTPLVEAMALDDLYLDVTQGATAGDRIARTMHEQVRDEIGIGISLGVGSNKLVARVATKQVKRQKEEEHQQTGRLPVQLPSVYEVAAGKEKEYLAPWRVEVLPGVGPKVEYRLHRLNVHQVGAVAAMPRLVLRQLFGVVGSQLHDNAHGIDDRPVTPRDRTRTISRSTSFDPPTSDPAFLAGMLDYLLERATSWLRYQGQTAQGLTITLRYGDYQTAVGHERLATPTQLDAPLREAAHERLRLLYTRRLPLRLLGVALTNLRIMQEQPDLFANVVTEREERLTACKDAIRERFGFTAVFSGTALALTKTVPRDRANFQLRTPCLTR